MRLTHSQSHCCILLGYLVRNGCRASLYDYDTIDVGTELHMVGLRCYDSQWPVPFMSLFIVSVVAGHVEIFSFRRPSTFRRQSVLSHTWMSIVFRSGITEHPRKVRAESSTAEPSFRTG